MLVTPWSQRVKLMKRQISLHNFIEHILRYVLSNGVRDIMYRVVRNLVHSAYAFYFKANVQTLIYFFRLSH